jgi:CHAD domain-containing protein
LRESAHGIEVNARGALASEDPEYLHQLRVNSRRLRSALRAFRPILPRKDGKRLRRSLRKLSPALGRARDWDVLAGRIATAGNAKRHQAARRAARDAIRSAAFAKMLQRARALRAQDCPQSLARFGAAALSRAHRKLMKAARDIDWSDAAQRHAVRIRVKRLRYTAEFFADAFKGSTPYVSALKELQRILGELNDIAVARRLVAADGDETALLRSLDAAWERFARRPPFWRAAR